MGVDAWLDSLFRDLDARPRYPETPSRRIALISTPRCGSSLLADGFRQTGCLGEPLEWYNMRYMASYARVNGLETLALGPYFKFIEATTTTPNGVFAVNFHVDQYLSLKSQGYALDLDSFDLVVFIWRRDKVRQAYSLAKARATDQWDGRTPAGNPEASFGRQDWAQALARLARDYDCYEQDLAPKVQASVDYETIAHDLDATVRGLADRAGVALSDTPITAEQPKQSGPADAAAVDGYWRFLGAER